MKNNWRTVAIILMILFLLSISFNIWIWKLGKSLVEKESECIWDICGEYDIYFYDSFNEICYCYEDDEIVKKIFLD